MDTLARIVRERDLKALEAFCLRRSYREVIEAATAEKIELDELEELLAEI